MGRGERAKRGTEALADHQDQGATVKKKKEQRMSREVAALGDDSPPKPTRHGSERCSTRPLREGPEKWPVNGW